MHSLSGLEGEGELQTPLRLRIERLYCRCAAPGIMSTEGTFRKRSMVDCYCIIMPDTGVHVVV